MRLTDSCLITRNGSPYLSGSWACELRHDRGDLTLEDGQTTATYRQTAVLMLGAVPELAALQSPSGLAVTHKGKAYLVDSILPRYRPGGRLHHISLRLRTAVPE